MAYYRNINCGLDDVERKLEQLLTQGTPQETEVNIRETSNGFDLEIIPAGDTQ